MTRLTIGGLAAGTFTLGILAGIVLPGTVAGARHDQLMASHMSAMAGTPMMGTGSMDMSMPMTDMSSMHMAPGTDAPAGHETHHASPEAGR